MGSDKIAMAQVPPDPDERGNSPLTVRHDELVAKAKYVSGMILDGKLTPFDGATQIFKECYLATFDGDHTFDPFVYWQDEYEDAQSDERRLYCADAIRQFAREFLGGPAMVLDPSELLPSSSPWRKRDDP
jgi:hypothetical protein